MSECHEVLDNKERLHWVDNVKVIACVLVAFGHFFQSMTSAGIIAQNGIYDWFEQTIYYFHVPLFFICSGYVYQKFSRVNSLQEWARNARKKIISLGIPYFTFSIATWCLKNVFSNAVNSEVDGLLYSLFVHPLSPYWYLFSLCFIFLITPTFRRKESALFWCFGVFLVRVLFHTETYVLSIVVENLIWFSLGGVICSFGLPHLIKRMPKWFGFVNLNVFLVLSGITHIYGLKGTLIELFMGLMGCLAVLCIVVRLTLRRSCLSPYTMPIYLMHTIFAAGVRAVLLKLGITAALIHISVGLIATFVGPIFAYEIMKRIRLDFFIEPRKYIRIE